ncbi:MAG: zinc-ribbon domain-containing protein [Sandarakinorhabdus sp.]|nr:zinc-ribbon domain-containing protein [Sandarakinorhabdus sp.]
MHPVAIADRRALCNTLVAAQNMFGRRFPLPIMSSRIGGVIVTCPQCAARYRLSDEVLARRGRLRCAACQHRWVPEAAYSPPEPVDAAVEAEPPPQPAVAPPRQPRGPVTEADEEAAFLAVQEQIRARWHDAATPVTPARDEGDEADDEPDDAPEAPVPADPPAPESAALRTAIAIIAGAALSIAAAGLWIGDRDLTGLPVIGPALVQLVPPSPVSISVAGTTTLLPSGKRLLEVNGTIANPGKTNAPIPPLVATLAGPDGVALRWTIATPRAVLPPGQQIAFSSTVTGFPESARTLAVAQAR